MVPKRATHHIWLLDAFHVWEILIDRVSQSEEEQQKLNVYHLFDHLQFVKVKNVRNVTKWTKLHHTLVVAWYIAVQILFPCKSANKGVSSFGNFTARKMRFFIKDFCGICDQIRRKVRIWSHLLKKSLMDLIFCVVSVLMFVFVFRTQWNIQFCENNYRLKAVKYFYKKLHLRYLTRFWIRLWSLYFLLHDVWYLLSSLRCFNGKNHLR